MAPTLEAFDRAAQPVPVKPVVKSVGSVTGVTGLALEGAGKHDLVLKVFRAYIADLCEQFNGGHPG
jgi:dihydroxyacetone synthase